MYMLRDGCPKIPYVFAGLHKETRKQTFFPWDVHKGTLHGGCPSSGFCCQGRSCDGQFLVSRGSCICFLMNSRQFLIGACHQSNLRGKFQEHSALCNLAGLRLLREVTAG